MSDPGTRMRDRYYRPDGRPWTSVRTTEELREATARGWTVEQIEVDVDAVRAEGYQAGYDDAQAGRPAAVEIGAGTPAADGGDHGWDTIAARFAGAEADQEGGHGGD